MDGAQHEITECFAGSFNCIRFFSTSYYAKENIAIIPFNKPTVKMKSIVKSIHTYNESTFSKSELSSRSIFMEIFCSYFSLPSFIFMLMTDDFALLVLLIIIALYY